MKLHKNRTRLGYLMQSKAFSNRSNTAMNENYESCYQTYSYSTICPLLSDTTDQIVKYECGNHCLRSHNLFCLTGKTNCKQCISLVRQIFQLTGKRAKLCRNKEIEMYQWIREWFRQQIFHLQHTKYINPIDKTKLL